MHIIFGKEQAELMSKRYTVLELDTFQIGADGPVVTAYGTVQNTNLIESQQLESCRQQHDLLLNHYKDRAWSSVVDLAVKLKGLWNGELDSFYQDLASRAAHYDQNPPGADWTPIIQK